MVILKTWTICSLDVWGNEKEGFDLNAAYKTSDTVELSEDVTGEEILKELIKQDILRPRFKRHVEIHENMIEIFHTPTGRPLLQLITE